VELYLHYPKPKWRGAMLKRRNNFTFTFILIVILLPQVSMRHIFHRFITYNEITGITEE